MGVRRSATLEARRLTTELVRRGLQTLVFTRSRSSVEVLLTYLQRLPPPPRPRRPRRRRGLQPVVCPRSRSSGEVLLPHPQRLHPPPGPGRPGPVRGYRSGYLPLE